MTEMLIDEVKNFSGLSEAEQRLLIEMRPVLEKHAAQIVDSFYEHLQKFERTNQILHAKPGRLEALRRHLQRWLVGLSNGAYDQAHFQDRYRIGHRHVEVGLEPRFVVAAMAFCRHLVTPIVEQEYQHDPQKNARLLALHKVMDIDLNIMLQSYDDKRIQQFLEVTGFSKELFENMIASSAGGPNANPDSV